MDLAKGLKLQHQQERLLIKRKADLEWYLVVDQGCRTGRIGDINALTTRNVIFGGRDRVHGGDGEAAQRLIRTAKQMPGQLGAWVLG